MKYLPIVIAIGIPVLFSMSMKHPIVKRKLISFLRSIEADKDKMWGIPVFVIVSTMVAIIFNDTFIANILAGYLYGPKKGTIIYTCVYLLATFGSYYTTSKEITTYVDTLERSYKPLHKLEMSKHNLDDDVLKELIVLSRLSPLVPYQLVSFIWYSSDISIFEVSIYSIIGVIPTTYLYCYLGSTLPSIKNIVHHKFNLHKHTMIYLVIFSVVVTYAIDKVAMHLLETHRALTPDK